MNHISRAIRAYPTLLRVGLAETVAYRAELFVWMLTTTMPLVSLALWTAVASEAPIGRFTAQRFGAYFVATLVVRQLTGSWIVWEMNFEIKNGTLARRLLKPIHPLISYSAGNLAAVPLRAALSLPITLILLWITEPGALPRDPFTLAIFFFSLVGAWFINFFSMALCGTLAFYFESSTAFYEIWLVAFMLLSGYLVPLELFPSWLRGIGAALPFRYTLAFPVEVFVGLLDRGAMLRDLAVQWAYVVGTGVGAIFAWRAGIKRFAAFGG